MADQDTPATGGRLTLDEAVDRLMPEDEDRAPDEDSAPTTGEDDEATPDAEDDSEDSEAEDDGESGDDEESEDEEADEDDESESSVSDESKVTLDDGTEVTVADLKRGHLFQKDYTKKTQALAEQRKEVEQTRERLNGFSESILERLKTADALVQELAPAPPDESLRDSDPVSYMMLRQEYQDAMQDYQRRLNEVRQGIQDTQSVKGEADQAQSEQELEQARERLREMIPEMREPEKAKQVVADIVSVTGELGFSPEEVSEWRDPRIGYLAHLAAQAKKGGETKAKAARKTKGKPPVKSRAKPTKTQSNKGKYGAAMRNLKKTGSTRDAVEALMLRNGLSDD